VMDIFVQVRIGSWVYTNVKTRQILHFKVCNFITSDITVRTLMYFQLMLATK
jgi:hypothetical protein